MTDPPNKAKRRNQGGGTSPRKTRRQRTERALSRLPQIHTPDPDPLGSSNSGGPDITMEEIDAADDAAERVPQSQNTEHLLQGVIVDHLAEIARKGLRRERR